MAEGQGREWVARQIGQRIKALRTDRKLSQEKLAQRASISHMTIYRSEAGRMVPEWDTLDRIAVALDVPLSDLLQFEGESRVYANGRVPVAA